MNSRSSAALALGTTVALVFAPSLPAASAPKSPTPDPTPLKPAVPKTTIPKKSAPKKSAPKKSAPKATAPKKSAPKATAPRKSAPKTTAPRKSAPKKPAPKTTPSTKTAPKATTRKPTTPKPTAPAKTTTQQAVAQGVGYVGETSQKASSISILLTKDRKRIKTLNVEWNERASQCTNGLPYVSSTTFGQPSAKTLPLTLTGTFESSYPFNVTIPGLADLTETSTITGKLGRDRASGTFRATVLLKDVTGKEINRCDTGRITWTAYQ